MRSEVIQDGTLVVAHELKQPLATIRQLAYSLEWAEDAAERQEISAQILRTATDALMQVNALTRAGALNRREQEVVLEPVAVRGICEEVSDDLKTAFEAREKTLQIAYQNRSRLVLANRDLLKTVLMNFCVNAAKYSGEETGSVLTVSDLRRARRVRLSVRDFGPALPPKLWRELSRGGLTRPAEIAMRPGGAEIASSGLGLYISSQFTRLMHGRIGAVRHRDGTSFYLELPALTQQELFLQ